MFNIACNRRSLYLAVNFIFFGLFQAMSKLNFAISRGFGMTFVDSCLIFGAAYSIAAIVRCLSGIFIDLIGHRNIPYVLLSCAAFAMVSLICLAILYFVTHLSGSNHDHFDIQDVTFKLIEKDLVIQINTYHRQV